MDTPAPQQPGPAESLDRRILLGAAGLAGIAALAAGRAHAGPLNPPAGAVAATGKTLTEVEPRIAVNAANTPGNSLYEFVISQPGSYYLTGPLTTTNTNRVAAISVLADDVTLDLNGFTITNTNGAGAGVLYSNTRFTIRNGTVVTGAAGISSGTSNLQLTAERITVINSNSSGITATGRGIITDCVVLQSNPLFGSYIGISVGGGSTVRNCTIAMASAASQATSRGVSAGSNCVVESCDISGAALGVHVDDGIVRGCRMQDQGIGIRVNGGLCERNSVRNPISVGISCVGATVVDNRIAANGAASAVGISISGPNNSVARNTITDFFGTNGFGIGFSVSVNAGGNKIMDNELVNNYRHLQISAPYNLIVRNSMSFVGAGGNSSIAAGNSFGPFINCGNTDLGTVAGTTHPQANFLY